MEYIMVTVFMKDNSDEWVDLELPVDLPIRKLIPLLVSTLLPQKNHRVMADEYNIEFRLYGSEWMKVEGEETLLSVDIWDGAYLRLDKAIHIPTVVNEIQHTIPKNHRDSSPPQASPVRGWRPLLVIPEDTRQKQDQTQRSRSSWKILE